MPTKCNKPIIIIMGPPGSGKGTQASLLAEKLGLYYFETSKIIELNVMNAKRGEFQIIEGKKYLLEEEKKIWKNGGLCSPQIVTFWVKEKIKNLAKENQGIIFAGSPRTIYEAENLMPLLEKIYKKENIKIVLLDLPPEQTLWRNSKRKICALMRHPIIYHNETKKLKICPLDGSKLVTRKGLDSKKSIRIRLDQYQTRTFPVIDYFKKNKYKVVIINATPAPSTVFSDICKALNIK